MTDTHSLKSRAKKSTVLITIGYVASQSLRLISNLILTRLLVPEMFGLMAIVTVCINGIAMFSDIGLQQNIVQSKNGEKKEFLNTAWTIQVIRGIVVFLIAIVLACLLGVFSENSFFPDNSVYSEPELPFLLALMSISSVISGFNSINIQVLNRKLILHKIISIELISQFIALLVMVLTAYFWREVWVLVLASLVSATVKMTLSHHPSLGNRPSFDLNKVYVHEILSFGKWIFFGSIVGFFLAQGDRLILGGLISSETLGIYSIAFFIANSSKEALKRLVNSVFYPMFSELVRENPTNLANAYYKLRLRVDFITMSMAGLMCGGGGLIISWLYDDRYLEAGWMFEYLSISIIFVGYSLAGACLMARGDSKSNTILILIAMLSLYISLPIAYEFYGLKGAILAIALFYAVDLPATFYMMKREGLLNIKKEFSMLPLFPAFYYIGHTISEYFS